MTDIDAVAGMSKKPKSKRRVLKSTVDNPLLRPSDVKKHHKDLTSLVKNSEITQMRVPSKFKAQIDQRSHSISQLEQNHSIAFDLEGLSDFVVNDSSSLREECSDNGFQSPPPRKTRRLIRGLRKRSSDSLLEVGEVRPTGDDQAKGDKAELPIAVVSERERHSRAIISELPESSCKNAKGVASRAGREKSPVPLSLGQVISSGSEQPRTLLKL